MTFCRAKLATFFSSAPLSVVVLSVISMTTMASAQEINFNRDIKPILSDRCFHCHGPDEENREGHLRLDVAEGADGAFRVRKNRAALVPGKPEQSHLYLRITTNDKNDVMPPPDSHKLALTSEEKETIKQWIQEGAKWAKHWAFEKPIKPKVPQASNTTWITNPVDNFILEKLDKVGLKPSPEAPRYKLIRRLSYDLNGLPPTPAEVDAFINDKSPNAYEKLVDRLLANKSYGERMALPWLDMSRYGDSSVFHADGPRYMWPWRDWVIEAYNNNKPFDEFTIEQIAGDHIKDRTYEQHVATAFLRNNGTTDEGGAFFEEYRVEYTVDRLTTVSKIWLGLTIECGQCHDHKYDPITQEEFYEMYAFFNVAADPGRQTRNGNEKPVIGAVENKVQKEVIKHLKDELASAEKQLDERQKSALPTFHKWLEKETAEQKKSAAKDVVIRKDLKHFFPLHNKYALDDVISDAQVVLSNVGSFAEVNGIDEHKDEKSKKMVAKTKGIDFKGQAANFGKKASWIESDKPFTISTWINYQPQKNTQVVLSRWDDKGKNGFDLSISKDHKVIISLAKTDKKDALVVESDKLPNHKKWQLLTVTYDGNKKGAGVRIFANGEELKTNVVTDTLNGSIANKSPFVIGTRGKSALKSFLSLLQIYSAVLTPDQIKACLNLQVEDFIYADEYIKDKDYINKMLFTYLNTNDKDYQSFTNKVASLQNNIKKEVGLNVMVMEDTNRDTYILTRGAYDQPQKDKVILPSTPKVLPPMKGEYPKNRLGLAQWIMDEDNPLTARVTVNRYWMMLFGHGLVDTVADFGNQGSWPTHPDLLDWLAVDFRESGWDVKRMIKQLVMSSTYRQNSNVNKELLESDKDNKLYARGPRFRLTGEHIRDTALFVSGLLNPQIGGPSVKPYQPPGLWAEVALTNAKFVQDEGDKNYRKSMYTYYKRSAPIPNMTTFDAPSREKCIIERSRTNTPLQALVTLNDPIFVEAARFFAERIMQEGGTSNTDKIKFAFTHAIARTPEDAIINLVAKLYDKSFADFKMNSEKSKELLAIGNTPATASLDPSELAAWTVVAQLILNMDETLNKE